VNVVGGTLAPGASAGTLTVNGSYSQDGNSTLAIEIGGTSGSGVFDLLSVSGSASLAGSLSVSLLNNPSLTVGDMFTVLSAGSVTGNLALTGPAASAFALSATSNSLVLEYLGGGVIDVDLDNDGDVDGRDFLLIQRTDPSLIPAWQEQYGSNSLSANIAIPEPNSLILLACVIATGVFGRREVALMR
jgi:outer membrane autotransporter protein